MRHCFVVRVFTRGADGGNHLGIVTDVVGLTDDSMQAIATDLGYSETIFVDSMTGEIPHVRIFTPTTELPFAGHPLVGAAWLLNHLAPEPHAELTCAVGTVTLAWDGTLAWIEAAFGQPVTDLPDLDTDRLGLPAARSAYEVRMPLSYVVVELESPTEVATFEPDGDRLLADPHGRHLSIWADAGAGKVRTRFFAPELGILEDPATGSAAVALAATLAHRGELEGRRTLHQGEEVGFPSTIELMWGGDRVRLGGTVVKDGVRELSI